MIKKIFSGVMFAAFMVSPASAFDYSKGGVGSWYLRGDVGIGFANYDAFGVEIFDMEDAVSFGGGIGYQFSSVLRTDVTFDAALDYSRSESFTVGGQTATVSGSADAYTVMGNAYVDVPMFGMFTPYVGAGIGYGWVEVKASARSGGTTVSASADDDGFAWGLMAGTAVGITENVAIDVGYKYRRLSLDGDDPEDHSFRGGVRFYF